MKSKEQGGEDADKEAHVVQKRTVLVQANVEADREEGQEQSIQHLRQYDHLRKEQSIQHRAEKEEAKEQESPEQEEHPTAPRKYQ